MSQEAANAKEVMQKSIAHLKDDFSRMRVGRANVAMVDPVTVDAYGSPLTLKEVAAINIPDARTIAITPWDKTLMGEIEKGILAANIGLTPNNDGTVIRLIMPPLTEERRKEYVKDIKKAGEETKVAIRNSRRLFNDELKSGDLSEDEVRRAQDEIQKVTDSCVKEVDALVDKKSQEVLSI